MVFYVLGMVLYFLGMLTAKVRLYLSGTTNEHKLSLISIRSYIPRKALVKISVH